MTNIAYNQILVLIFQIFLVSSLILLLFRLRSIFGLGPLFATLGVFQYMQVFLASAIYINIAPGIVVSPGSVVLFTGGLFAIVLIYIREDALEARKIIYALLAANLVLTCMHLVFGWSLDGQNVENIYQLPKAFFTHNSLILIIGSLALFVDCFVIIILYEFISRSVKSIFLRILITMTIVVILDSILFSIGVFAGTNEFKNIFISGVVSKFFAVFVYSIIFAFYLHFFEKINIYNSTISFNDIFHKLTYRQKFEKVFEEKEKQHIEFKQIDEIFQSVWNNSSDGMRLTNEDGIIVSVNRAYCKLVEKPMEEIIGHPLSVIYKESAQENILAKHKERFRARAIPTYLEREITLWNGKIIFLELSNGFINIQNRPTLSLSIFRDITERKKNEKELSLYHKKLIQTQKIAKVAFINWDLKTGKFEVSDELLNMYGIKQNELVDFKTFEKLVPPEEYKYVSKGLADAAKGIKNLNIDHRIIRPDGEIIWVNSKAVLERDENGDPNNLFGTITNITERKNYERELKDKEEKLTEAEHLAEIGDFLWNVETGKVSWSKGMHSLLKYDENENIDYAKVNLAIHHPDDLERVTKWLNDCLSSGKQKLEPNEYRIIRKDGKIIDVHTEGNIYYDEKGKPLRVFGMCQNITERNLLVNSLKENEVKFRNIFEHSIDAIGVSIDGIHKFINPAYLKLFGYSNVNELINKPIFDLIAPNEHSKILEYVRQRKDGRQVTDIYQTRGIKKDGTEFDMDVHATAFELFGKNHTLAILRDITQSKRAERELIASKTFNENLINTSPDAIYIYDIVNKKNVFSNRGLESILGYNSKEINKFGEKLLEDLMHPKDRDNYLKNILQVYQQVKDGEVIEHEYRMKHKNGSWVWLRSKESIYARNTNGTPSQIFGIASDVTQQKNAQAQLVESESNLAALINNSDDFIWSIDLDYNYIIFNKKYADIMFDIHGIELKTGMNSRDFISAEELEFWEEKFEAAANGEQIMFEFSYDINGTEHYFETSFNPILEGDKITSVSCRSTEITPRKLAENNLKKTLKQLNKSKSQLRSLNRYVQNIREKERTDISREIHDTIGQALTALKLDLAWLKKHLKINDNELSPKLNEMRELIDETTSSVQKISTELRPGILDELGLIYALNWQCIEFEKRTDIKTKLKINPENIKLNEKTSVELFRILQESLTNVIRHANASTVNVSLNQNRRMVEMVISDNGVGIQEDDINSVHSLGLLSITERALSVNGKVSFTAEENGGTKVKVVLELEKEDELV